MSTCYINDVAAVCALGDDVQAIAAQLFSTNTSPLTVTDDYTPGNALPVGRVSLTRADAADTRNNTLLQQALNPLMPRVARLRDQYGAHRLGVILGSSTSGIAEGEAAVAQLAKSGQFPGAFRYAHQEMTSPAQYAAQQLQVTGPAWTISTACTSGAKAIASGARLLQAGICDAVVVGGADTLCRLTLRGFSSLEAVSREVCNPFSRNRSGINIGEAAALMILSREPGSVRFAAAGESSDAYHISAPHPEGKGAEMAMAQALAEADLSPSQVDYINTHGTATQHNDHMESLAIARLFGDNIACGSTKPLSGHTLGAAGALEAVFCWLTLTRNDGLLPRHLWDGQLCPEGGQLRQMGRTHLPHPTRFALSNSFAFGGNNISLLLEQNR